MPVQPLCELEGCRTILVVHLSGSSRVEASLFPDIKLVEAFPSAELGGPAGTFDFTAKGARCGWNWATGTVWNSWRGCVSPNLNQTLIDLPHIQ